MAALLLVPIVWVVCLVGARHVAPEAFRVVSILGLDLTDFRIAAPSKCNRRIGNHAFSHYLRASGAKAHAGDSFETMAP